MIVREAELWDVPALFGLAEKFHGEATLRFPLPNAEAIYRTILETKRFSEICCFVAEDKEIFGFIVGVVSRLPHSFYMIGTETMFFIEKKERGGTAAKLLLRHFTDWCWGTGVKFVSCGSISGIKEERYGKFLEKLGFRWAGAAYIKEKQ